MSQKIHVKHILVQQKYEAEDLEKKMKDGAKFEDLAQKFSTCPSAKQGGDLGEVESRRFVEEFAEAAEKLKPNEVSPIVRTRFGYHLIYKVK